MESGKIRYLKQKEKQATRGMYEAAFPEDSKEFVDYYYSWKIKDNKILVMEGTGDDSSFHVMVHLNPYHVCICENVREIPYIVAVATDLRWRRQGKMSLVMAHALRDMEQKKVPFTFLLPADPAYYRGQGFVFFPCQECFGICREDGFDSLEWEPADTRDADKMASFSNRILEKRYDIYIRRDHAYYCRLFEELKTENGGAILLKRKGNLCGVLLYGISEIEDGATAEVKELQLENDISEEKAKLLCEKILREEKAAADIKFIPSRMMVRITNLLEFVPLMKSKERILLDVEVTDSIIAANNGCFRIEIDRTGGRINRLPENFAGQKMDIAKLTERMFEDANVYLNEWV